MKYPNRVSRVRFIIICTYLLSNTYNVSPLEFQSLSRIENEDLILTREDSIKLPTLKEIGLPFALHNYSIFLKLMVNECAGHIGALRISVEYFADQLKLSPTASERAAVDWVFRMDLSRRMERCLGGGRIASLLRRWIRFFTSYLLVRSTAAWGSFPPE